jgi:hypothetical protein
MKATGFVNVQHILLKWPANPWPADQKHKTLGLWTLANALDGIEGFTIAMFTRVLGGNPEEVHALLVKVRRIARIGAFTILQSAGQFSQILVNILVRWQKFS